MAVKISALFDVLSGDFHALKELEPGQVPLVSCGDTDNGIVGYFDIPSNKQYNNAVTVAYNGSWPIMSKYHPYTFGAKDDVAVLIPHSNPSGLALLYVAALLNRMTWRYSYGRKCFREKLQNVQIDISVKSNGNQILIDEEAIRKIHTKELDVLVREIAGGASDWMKAAI